MLTHNEFDWKELALASLFFSIKKYLFHVEITEPVYFFSEYLVLDYFN